MIISKTIFVKSSKYYEGLGYDITDRYIEIKIEDLTLGSNFKIIAKCFYCDKEKTLSYKKYNNNISNNGNFSCSNKCSSAKRKETILKLYSVEHYSKTTEYKERFKKTNLERYGFEHAMKSNIIKEKLKDTLLCKYEVENVFQSNIIKDKIKETNLEKYGVINYSQTDECKDKKIKTNLEKYNVDNYTQSEEHHLNTIIGKDENYIKYLGDNISLLKCNKGHDFEISKDIYHNRVRNNISLCTICNPIGDSKSIKEKDLLEFITLNYTGEIISSYRDKLEIDIYLPELGLGFEFNGLYWHSEKYKEKSYHLDKTNHFKERDIRIIHIWEDDWIFKQNIVKSQILNLFGKSNKIFARKCFLKEVDTKSTRKFLDDNHIQGFVSSIKKIGLYYNNELVSIMTFDHNEGRKKMEDGGWNLSRFCNKIGYNIVGGSSKLLSHFIKEYNPSRIVSYADKDWSIGNLYYKLGFENIGGNGPDYKYIVDGKRVHKSRFKKSKLNTTLTESREMLKRDILKIYDCGKIKFECHFF